MKEKIAEIIKGHTKDNPVTLAAISNIIGVEENSYSKPKIRMTIKEIIDEMEVPIGNCRKGYFLIKTDDELKETIDNLTITMKGIKRRIAFLKFAYASSK